MRPRPALIHDHARLLAAAEQLLAGRRDGDPASVAARKLTEAQAASRLRIMTAFVDQWRAFIAQRPYVCQHERWLDSDGREGASESELRETIEAAAQVTAKRVRAGAASGLELACAIEALAWWQQPADRPPHVITRLGRMHAEAEADRLIAMAEAA